MRPRHSVSSSSACSLLVSSRRKLRARPAAVEAEKVSFRDVAARRSLRPWAGTPKERSVDASPSAPGRPRPPHVWRESTDASLAPSPTTCRRAGTRSTRPRCWSEPLPGRARRDSAEWLAQEYYEDDFHDMAGSSASERGVSTLFEANGGSRAGATLAREHAEGGARSCSRPCGRRGETRGHPRVPRARASRDSTARRSTSCGRSPQASPRAPSAVCYIGEASDPDGPTLRIGHPQRGLERRVGHSRRRARARRAARRRLGGEGRAAPAVLSVAGRALRTAEDRATPRRGCSGARALQRGRWIVLHGATMAAGGARRVAVIVESAHPAR